MALIIALNVFLVALVVLGIVSLLSWGIATDRVPRRALAAAGDRQARQARQASVAREPREARVRDRAPRSTSRPAQARG